MTLGVKFRSDPSQYRPLTTAQADALGLNEVKGLIVRFGFQGEAFLTDWRIEAASPRKGVNAWFDQPTFRKNQLPTLPQAVATFAVGSIDLDKMFQSMVDLGSSLDPSVGDDPRQLETIVHDQTNAQFREDILKFLGPTFCVYMTPARPGDHEPRDKSDPMAYVCLAAVKDAVAFGNVLDKMVAQADANQVPGHGDGAKKMAAKKSPSSFLERLPSPQKAYRLTSSAAGVLGLGEGVRPTIMIGKSFVTVAANPELAREALAAESRQDKRWKPTGKLANAFDGMPSELTFLAVADHRGSQVPQWLAELPSLTQILVNMSEEVDLDNASPWSLLDMFCLPRPGRFQAKIDRSEVPDADDLRPFLFPSVLGATVDERGYRFISRATFPLALLANEAVINYYFWLGWTNFEGLRFEESLHFRIFGLGPIEW